MNKAKWLAVTAVAGLVLAGGCSTMCKKPVTSVPAAAQKTIDQFAEGGTIHELEMKKKCGMVLYEAEVKTADGSKIEIVVNAEGKLYKLERKEERKHE
ncbi:MAG: hypothetical protein WCL44_10160 [bacterium]